MAFTEWTRMQRRQKKVRQALQEGKRISTAAREAGVSRQTASLWVARARQSGLAELGERSARTSSDPVWKRRCKGGGCCLPPNIGLGAPTLL